MSMFPKLAVFQEQPAETNEAHLVNRLLSWRRSRQNIEGLVFSNAPVFLIVSAELSNGILTVVFCDAGTHAYFGFTPKMVFTQVSDAYNVLQRISRMLESNGDLPITVQAAALIYSAESASAGKSFSKENLAVSELPEYLFPPFHTRLVPDFESSCRCLLAFLEQGQHKPYFQPLWASLKREKKKKEAQHLDKEEVERMGIRQHKPYLTPHTASDHVVIFVGHEVGAATIALHRRRAEAVFMSTNAFCSVPAPVPADQHYHSRMRILNDASRQFHHGRSPATYADILSSQGLQFLVRYFRKKLKYHAQGADGADLMRLNQIMQLAYEEPTGPEGVAMDTFCGFLMQYVQNSVLAMRTDSVFLAGELVGFVREYLLKNHERMRRMFLSHPTAEWLSKVDLKVQGLNASFSLLGGLITVVEG